jgi:cysteine-rich repeat protein
MVRSFVAALGLGCTLLAGAAPEPARAGAEELCGNGALDGDEECDDGNLEDGDGCNATCRIRLCLAAPPSDCIAAARASLSVRQKITEKKDVGSLNLSIGGFSEEVSQLDFGDPVFDTTRYDLCIYGQDDRLRSQLIVSRGFRSCGEKKQSCWKLVRDQGYLYRDPDLTASGVGSMLLLGGSPGAGKIEVRGRRTKESQRLPRISGVLAGHTRASLRLMVGGGRCVSASLDDVQIADENRFRARSASPAP